MLFQKQITQNKGVKFMTGKKILSIVFLFTILVSNSIAQDYTPEQMEAAQKAWMEYMTLSSTHKHMAKSAGEWISLSKMWQAPNTEPTEWEGTNTSEMILGNRYMKSVLKGEIMGMAFEGLEIVGFDNDKNEFTSVWYDNLGTGTTFAKGTFDEKTNSITLKGMMYDPISKKEYAFRQVIKMISPDHHIREMYSSAFGDEFLNMVVDMKRKK
jgi:hypothetical protein